ncbi:MAG: hypothetical protein ACP5I3_12630, partial [Thermoproteus sp.]
PSSKTSRSPLQMYMPSKKTRPAAARRSPATVHAGGHGAKALELRRTAGAGLRRPQPRLVYPAPFCGAAEALRALLQWRLL